MLAVKVRVVGGGCRSPTGDYGSSLSRIERQRLGFVASLLRDRTREENLCGVDGDQYM